MEQSVPAHKQHRKKHDPVPRSISWVDGDTGLYTGDNIFFMEYVDLNDWGFFLQNYIVGLTKKNGTTEEIHSMYMYLCNIACIIHFMQLPHSKNSLLDFRKMGT